MAIFGLGAMLPEAMRLAVMLEREGFSAAVINPRFAKPIDRACVAEYGRHCGLMVTLEDHVLAGGFGSAVLETLNELELAVPVVRVGWPDSFIEHGKVEALREKYGLTAEAALEKARPIWRRWTTGGWRCGNCASKLLIAEARQGWSKAFLRQSLRPCCRRLWGGHRGCSLHPGRSSVPAGALRSILTRGVSRSEIFLAA